MYNYNNKHKANTNECVIRLPNDGVARSQTKFTDVYLFQDVNVWQQCRLFGDAHTKIVSSQWCLNQWLGKKKESNQTYSNQHIASFYNVYMVHAWNDMQYFCYTLLWV